MNIIQQQKLLEALTDQEIQGANAPEYLKQVEVKRRVEMRNAYQAQQQQADDNKTVAEKNMEELMMGGIPSADPMMGQGGDPSMQAGIAGGMEGQPEGPPMPPMMYGGGMLGFHEGGTVGHRHPHDPNNERLLHGFIPVAKGPLYGRDFSSAEAFVASHEGQAVNMPSTADWKRMGGTEGEYMKLATMLSEGASSAMEATGMTREELYQKEQDALADSDSGLFLTQEQLMQQSGMGPGLMGFTPKMPEGRVRTGTNIFGDVSREERAERSMTNPEMYDLLVGQDLSTVNLDRLERMTAQTESGAISGYDNREQLLEMYSLPEDDPRKLTKAQYEAGMRNLLTGAGAINPETGERLTPEELAVNQVRYAIADAAGQKGGMMGGGAGSPDSFFNELRGLLGDQLERERDPELRAKSRQLETDATNREMARARGIKSLSDARIEEQTQLLAEELGMSKDRVNELRNEMETPESLEKRRRASLFSALGATIAGDPRGLAAGLERTTDKLISLDDKIALETKAQRDAIRAEKEKGFGVKKAGKSAIYGETLSGEKDLGNALSSFDDANVAMQKAIESQDVDAYSRHSDRMTNLLLEQARAATAAMDSQNQANAMLAKIQQEGKNYWVNPVNWPHIDNLIMHTRAQADRYKDTDPVKSAQMHASADNFEAMKTLHATESGTGVVTDKVTMTGPPITVPGATSP